MNKFAAIVLLSAALTEQAIAQDLGCLGQPRGTQCSTDVIECTPDLLQNRNLYGTSIGLLCTDYEGFLQSITELQLKSSADETAWNNCMNGIASYETSQQYLEDLASRLRKKCGSKCKKIH